MNIWPKDISSDCVEDISNVRLSVMIVDGEEKEFSSMDRKVFFHLR